MIKKQIIKNNAKSIYPIAELYKESVVTKSEKEGNNNSLLQLAINNNHFLYNCPKSLPAISNNISYLTNISEINTPLLLEVFEDLDENLMESPLMK